MNMELLETKMNESGYKREFIAEKIGLTRFGLLKKINNPATWKVTEMTALIKLLKLSKSDAKIIFDL